ncbi:MAG: DUF1385 domain-containing protein [Anaerolineales bacterium]|nr:DUF1385 domain-containing protein [Anaerolineales bacterium]
MESSNFPTYGGQAVIEGVMMRGRKSFAIAMRAPDNNIVIHEEPLGGIYKSRIAKIPFLRGLVMLWDAMGLGIRALTISANIQNNEDEKLEGGTLLGTVLVALVFAIGLFFMLPAAVGQLTEVYLSWSAWWGNIFEGFTRLLIVVGYIYMVGRIPDIQRVFAYHGAEHKTINAFEDGVELNPENVSKYSLQHPRCGTAFLLTLVLVSIIVFALLGPLSLPLRLASRLILLPLLAGLAYEYIRWTANKINLPFVRLLVWPNLALQQLTTREPTKEMLEVSIAAFNAMHAGEKRINL